MLRSDPAATSRHDDDTDESNEPELDGGHYEVTPTRAPPPNAFTTQSNSG